MATCIRRGIGTALIFLFILASGESNAKDRQIFVATESLHTQKQAPGALVRVSAPGLVGVLLDEIPPQDRDNTVHQLMQQPASFWISRAHEQLKLMTYRLVFRSSFYKSSKKQLPLPPENVWKVKLTSKPYRDQSVGHDIMLIRYEFSSVLVAPVGSPEDSEPSLKTVGRHWSEQFLLPLDPELLFQRTRFACVNESEFPPHSVDAEEMSAFYDQTCDIEPQLSNRTCHQTEMPMSSCEEALKTKTGILHAQLTFVRMRWNKRVARQYTVGSVTNPHGPDLQVFKQEFRTNRLIYRYISPDSCTVAEKCVGGTGWRRLLQFSTADENTGTTDLDIGLVDYFIDGVKNPLQMHHVFEYSTCHNHYHFTHYGQFSFGDATVSKRGFCLQSTNRVANRTTSPLSHVYGDCRHQGISAGWVDEYRAGLECQWVDITEIDTRRASITRELKFISNPDGFLCEGKPLKDEAGNQLWESTHFKTALGEPVDRPKCDFLSGWFSNNTDSYEVTLPHNGEGYITTPCSHGEIGPLRNCGFKYEGIRSCKAGTMVHQTCSSDKGTQIARICDASVRLNAGTACNLEDALANVVVTAVGSIIDFKCSTARDPGEPGGFYSLYNGPISPLSVDEGKIICISGSDIEVPPLANDFTPY